MIRSRGFDILDNLPHFLLTLLIIQRFDLARWGFFTAFKESRILPLIDETCPGRRMLQATFEDKDPICIYPSDDLVCGEVNLLGRSTGLAGARRKADHDPKEMNSAVIRKGNDMVVKFSWPRSSRESEADFIKSAREIGESNGLVEGHIPTVLGHLDPPYVTCSTKPIRQFLGLDVNGERVLRVIAFRRLEEIKFLGKEDMFIAFLDTFFCEPLPQPPTHPTKLILW